MKLWALINFGFPLHILAVKKAYFTTVSFWNTIMNSLIVSLEKWNWEGKSAKSWSEMLPFPFPHPPTGRSPFRGGTKKRVTFQTSQVGAWKPA